VRHEDTKLDSYHILVPLENGKGYRIERKDAPWLLDPHLRQTFASAQEARKLFTKWKSGGFISVSGEGFSLINKGWGGFLS
jgi:hypothetical protein